MFNVSEAVVVTGIKWGNKSWEIFEPVTVTTRFFIAILRIYIC